MRIMRRRQRGERREEYFDDRWGEELNEEGVTNSFHGLGTVSFDSY